MADFSLANGLSQEAWSKNYTKAYLRLSGFKPYMGTSVDSVIRVNRDLTKHAGDVVNIPYFKALAGAGVSGSTTLKGSEEALANYGVEVRVTTRRNAVMIPESQQYKTDLELANIARDGLKDWSGMTLRDDIIAGLGSISATGGADPDSTVVYGSASAAQKNAWGTANADRVIFGSQAVGSSGTHATDLGTIANTEVFTATMLDAAVDAAQATSGFKINPIRTDDDNGREYFVLFVGTRGYNQLKADADIKAANREAWTRDEMRNPIFQGGDLLWNGVIIRKIPEIAVIGAVGTSSAQVAPAYLCGSNAIGVAYAAMPEARSDVDDYGERKGVAIREVRGTKKMSCTGVDTGMVTVFYATGL